jgi:hypothetical protein
LNRVELEIASPTWPAPTTAGQHRFDAAADRPADAVVEEIALCAVWISGLLFGNAMLAPRS